MSAAVAAAVPVPIRAPEEAPRAQAPLPPCPPLVAGRALARGWQQRLGQRFRLRASIDRSIDITTRLIRADGELFAVLMDPSVGWDGREERTYSVMGSVTVPMHGALSVPQLVLTEPVEACE